MLDSFVCRRLVFDSRSKSDVFREVVSFGQLLADQVDSLREEQPVEVWRLVDEVEQPPTLSNQVGAVLEHIGHRRAEYTSAHLVPGSVLIPFDGFFPVGVTEETPRRVWAPKSFPEALCPRFRVAVIACRRHLDTTPPGVEGMMRPLDARVFSHCLRRECANALLYSSRVAHKE